jgi:hypothetical protein
MAYEQTGKSAEQAAKLIGMPINSYREVRDIVLLATCVELTAKDTQQAAEALQFLDETRLLSRSHEMVKSIAERFWGPKGQRSGGENRRLEELKIQFLSSRVSARRPCAQFALSHRRAG